MESKSSFKVIAFASVVLVAVALRACTANDPYQGTHYSEDAGCDGSVCNGNIPLSNSEGAPMNSVDSFRIDVCAELTKTINDAGAVWVYTCKAKDGLCSHNQALDQPIILSGERCLSFPDFKVGYISNEADTVVARPRGMSVTGADGGGGYSISTTIFTHRERYK